MSFESILRTIAEETDRDVVSDLASRYPTLREFVELGEQAKFAMPHLAKWREVSNNPSLDLATAVETGVKWENWKHAAWDPESRMTKEERIAKEMLSAAQDEVSALRARGETDMTGEEIDALVERKLTDALTAMGVVTKDKFADFLPDNLKTAATRQDVDRLIDGWGNRFEEVAASLIPESVEHRQKFNERLDVNKIITYMKDFSKQHGRAIAAEDAYKAVYRDKFEAADKATRDKELADTRQAGVDEGRRMAQQSSSGRGMPIDSRGAVSAGPVMKRWAAKQQKTPEGQVIDAPLGKGIIAMKAAENYEKKESAAGAA